MSSSKKQRAQDKMARIPIKIKPELNPKLKKPEWIKVKASYSSRPQELKALLREHKLYTVCEEASCPNLPECFSKGTATFMILGDKCTRRCAFCDVGHGRPDPVDQNEPKNLAKTVAAMKLNYVVITSVDRDDLLDGGAAQFASCIQELRELCPTLKIEILVPDFRGRMEKALAILNTHPCDVFNHNLETVEKLYKAIRPGSDYKWSLKLLAEHKKILPHIPTKSGVMVGLGETMAELKQVLRDLRAHHCDMLTVGQYLQPSEFHAPVLKYYTPAEFLELEQYAYKLGFQHAACGPMVRSSYHADEQAKNIV